MLIRSQDKTRLVDSLGKIITVKEWKNQEVWKIMLDDYFGLGIYKNKEKAIKVLDMIQKAHAEYESNRIVSTGLAVTAYTGGYDTKESVAHGVKVLKEYAKTLESTTIFQMPEDSEVEI